MVDLETDHDPPIKRILEHADTKLPSAARESIQTASIGGVRLVQGTYRTDGGEYVSIYLGLVDINSNPHTMLSLVPLEEPVQPPTVANTYNVPIEQLRELPFGGIVRRLRLEAGITQRESAKRGDIASGRTLVTKIERGGSTPTRRGASKYIQGLGLNPEEETARLLISKASSKAGIPIDRAIPHRR